MKLFSKDSTAETVMRSFALITLWYAMIAVIGGVLARVWYWRHPERNPLFTLTARWAEQLKASCYEQAKISWRVRTTTKLDDYPGLTIVLINHPCNVLITAPFVVVSEHIASRIMVTLKSSHLLNPMGFGLWGIQCGIFINRLYDISPFKKWSWLAQQLKAWSRWWYKRQIQRIAKQAQRSGHSVALTIFADQRFTAERLQRYQQRYHAEIPAIMKWSQVLLPKSGGTLAVLQACAELPIRIVDMTIGCSKDASGWVDIAPLLRATLYAKIEDVTEAVRNLCLQGDLSRISEAALQGWLVKRWDVKDQRLLQWRNSSRNNHGH